MLHRHDVRSAPASPEDSKPIWRLQAHDEAVTAFDVNPHVPGFLATGSNDKEVKLWNVVAALGPSMIVSRNLDVGKVFSTTFGPDRAIGFRLVVAGSKGSMQVWDTSTNGAVRRAFADRIGSGDVAVPERLVRIKDDDDDDDDDGDDDDEEGDQDEDQAVSREDGWESMDESE